MALHALPVRLSLRDDEALESYLERLACANHIDRPGLLRLIAGTVTHVPIDPPNEVVDDVAALTGQDVATIEQSVLASCAGITSHEEEAGWRHAGRAWAPGRGTQLCPACIVTDGVWRVTWRHPWVTVCLVHRIWLHAVCPTCGLAFRMNRSSPLRSVDAAAGTCGNPGGARGRTCPQHLGALASLPAPAAVLASQERITTAIHHQPLPVLGSTTTGEAYLEEIRVLAVLLLHLACQDRAEALAPWADAARLDHSRSAAGRGARWGLAPPGDPVLRGHSLAAADNILTAHGTEEAAERLGPWLDLTPPVPEGQLGWLADHTHMTPTLTLLVMSATATRRRISTLLDTRTDVNLASTAIPQTLPTDLYASLATMLDVTEPTGRLFASLCLARRHTSASTWAQAATSIGLPGETGTRTARACSADLLVRPDALVQAIDVLAESLDPCVDYRHREDVVRHLARRRHWYPTWAAVHLPGSPTTSSRYAVTWLWTTWAHGHIDTSPGWAHRPDHLARARYRRYAGRLTPTASRALESIAQHAITIRRYE